MNVQELFSPVCVMPCWVANNCKGEIEIQDNIIEKDQAQTMSPWVGTSGCVAGREG